MSNPWFGAWLALAAFPFPAIAAQDTDALLGRWLGAEEANAEMVLVIDKTHLTIDGDKLRYRRDGDRVLVLTDVEDMRVEYRLDGDRLSLTVDGETQRSRRDAPRPENPSGKRDNPLRRSKPADPFATTFRGDDLELRLTSAGNGSYRGTIILGGSTYPVTATAEGTSLRGSLRVENESYEFTAELAKDTLTLRSDGETYRLQAQPAETAETDQRETPDADGERGADAPPALEGVDHGPVTDFQHRRGWFACSMPRGWTVHSEDDAGMLVNPGLTANDTLDAIVFLTWGRLEANDRNQPVTKLIERHLPTLQQGLEQQGIRIGKPRSGVQKVRGKDVPGAMIEFEGQTQQGQRVSLWIGGLVKQDSWISVGGVFLAGKEARFLPKVKRMFTSLEPKPPQRNAKLERAMVGKTFNSSIYGKVTGSAHHASYSFHDGGTVVRRLMSNVISTPDSPGISADGERTGRYEVNGDIVFLYFDSGQEAGQVLTEGDAAVGMRIGSAEYR